MIIFAGPAARQPTLLLGQRGATLQGGVALLVVGKLDGYATERAGEGEGDLVPLADRRAVVAAAVEAALGRHERPGSRQLDRSDRLAVDQQRPDPAVLARLG